MLLAPPFLATAAARVAAPRVDTGFVVGVGRAGRTGFVFTFAFATELCAALPLDFALALRGVFAIDAACGRVGAGLAAAARAVAARAPDVLGIGASGVSEVWLMGRVVVLVLASLLVVAERPAGEVAAGGETDPGAGSVGAFAFGGRLVAPDLGCACACIVSASVTSNAEIEYDARNRKRRRGANASPSTRAFARHPCWMESSDMACNA
jgi:hypothetical protein